jgi:ABC-type transport system involved in multi-copper enzyme maturation permease subunit
MITGPIFRVEMVSAARRRRYFTLRVLYSAIILFVLWVTYESAAVRLARNGAGGHVPISQTAETAATFFYTFSWIQIAGILLVAPAMAVGTIATERERRTIEYLFTTDLSNIEIVLGKTVARLLLIGQLVLASLPILFIFRLLGGIPANLLAASFLVSASTALIVTAISVCISVWSPRARDAAMRVYRALAVLVLGPVLALPLLALLGPTNPLVLRTLDAVRFLWEVNPLVVLGQAMSSSFAVGAGFDFGPVLRMTAWHVGVSIVLIAWATLAVRRVHLRESGRGSVSKSKLSDRLPKRWRWRPTLGDNPILWKEAFAPTAKIKLGWIGAAANAIVVVGAATFTSYMFTMTATGSSSIRPQEYFYYTGTFTGVIGSGLLLLLGARASSLFALEKERDTWISLISTPLTGKEIVLGKLWGNLYSGRWGFLLLALTWASCIVFETSYALVFFILAGTFLLAAVFATSVGLLFSLHSATSLRAMGLTLMTGLLVGGGYMLCCMPILAMSGSGDESLIEVSFAPCLTFLIVAPAMMFASGMEGSSVEIRLMTTYVVGVIIYLIANSILVAWLIYNFDAAAGRTADVPDAYARS